MDDITSIIYQVIDTSATVAILFYFLNKITKDIGAAVTKLNKSVIEEIKPLILEAIDKMQHNINESESIKTQVRAVNERVEAESRRTQDVLTTIALKRNGIK